jgi:acyl carrier protein phosphodiesterase
MNHLAHFFLSSADSNLLVGGFLGDFVKGRLKGERTRRVEDGIKLHRAIDAYTDQHAITRLSQKRFDPRFRRFAGIMTDIIFDHFLALHWHKYHGEDLQTFSDATFGVLLGNREHLPALAIKACERMHDANALLNYRKPEFVHRSFCHLSTRLRRDNPLTDAYEQFLANRDELDSDFGKFFPALTRFADNWIGNLDRRALVKLENT